MKAIFARRMISPSFLLWASMLCALPLFGARTGNAQSKPGPEAAKSVIDFYFNGQGKGVVLADIKVCKDIVDTECTETVDHSLLKIGEQYKIWMAYLVPEGEDLNSLSIQFSKDGEVQYARELSVKGSLRYRTWRTFNPGTTGIWEVKVMDNREVELEELAKLSLVVGE